MIERLQKLFSEYNYQWNISGELKVPTQDDIKLTLDRTVERLYTEPTGTQLEVGRLIVRKMDEGHEVYLHMGDYNDNSNTD